VHFFFINLNVNRLAHRFAEFGNELDVRLGSVEFLLTGISDLTAVNRVAYHSTAIIAAGQIVSRTAFGDPIDTCGSHEAESTSRRFLKIFGT